MVNVSALVLSVWSVGLSELWTRPRSKWWRILLGLFAGVLLYWAFVFEVLPLIPRGVIRNPFSALILPMLGGWLGSDVFPLVLGRLGLSQKVKVRQSGNPARHEQ